MEQSTSARVRLLFACSIGTIIEWYDFAIFLICTALVFNKTFFPTDDPFTGILAGLAASAVGFVARPLGGLIFGWLGDRVGRKNSLVMSLLLMGVATFAMGLLPTYASVGLLAPALLVALRILQGIAVGGEATGAFLLVAESMPARHRAFWTSFPFIGGPAGNVLAAFVIGTAITQLGNDQFIAWGWRIPFLLSFLLVAIGIWSRSQVEESPVFRQLVEQKKAISPAPLTEAVKGYLKPIGQVFFVKAAENTLFYLFTTFFIILVTQFLAMPRGAALNAIFWGSILEVFVIMASAWISDYVGRRPMMILGFVLAIGASFTLFTLEKGVSPETLIRVTMLTLTCHGVLLGGMAAYFVELFPTRVRYTAMSTSYQLASVFGGSVAPILGTILLEKTGTPFAVAIYAAIIAIPALIILVLSRETKGTDLNAG